MSKSLNKVATLGIIFLLISSLSACSKIRGVFSDDANSVNYQNNASVKNLEFPPDLTAPKFDKEFELPKGVVSAVSLKSGGRVPAQTYNSTSGGLPNNVQSYSTRTGALASIKTQGGETLLQVNDTYQRAQILTSIMLERMSFTVLSRDPASGILSVRYNGSDVDVGEPKRGVSGFFNSAKGMLGMSNANDKALVSGETYRVSVLNQQGAPLVRIARASGSPLSTAANAKIITMLNNEFNR